MIILFLSYARNNYVAYDEKFEFRKLQFCVSDYGILVVTSGVSDGVADKYLDVVETLYYNRAKDLDRQLPIQFISEDMKKLNKYLDEGRYFYTQIKDEGVMLYDSKKFKLARKRKLNFDEIQQQAQEYFDSKFERGIFFFDDALINKDKERYQMASFYLHQACESYIYATSLVFTLLNPKQHNLSKLLNSVKQYSDEFVKVFPQDRPKEKRHFKLIKAAYVEGRTIPILLSPKKILTLLSAK